MKVLTSFRVSKDARNLFIALCVGLIHGLIYLFLLPPWQHYDEPNHFEYIRLIADRGRLPEVTDYDRSMRLEVAQSMIDTGFFRGMDIFPDLNNPDQPIWIGPISQLGNAPFYYLVAALPVRIFHSQSVEFQLMVARLVSLGFFLITLVAAWGVMIEIAPEHSVLRLVLPLSLAMLPGFVDVMTAVNSDAAAVGLVSLCLWGSIRLVRRGLRQWTLLGTLVVAILCLFTKETAYVAILVFFLAVLLALFRERYRWVSWALIAVVFLAVLITFLSGGGVASWYRSTSQATPSQVRDAKDALGEYVFRVESGAEVTPRYSVPIFQPLSVFPSLKEGDKVYTLGAWMWAEEPAQVRTPTLGTGLGLEYRLVDVGIEPSFFAFTATVPTTRSTRLWVGLNPANAKQDIGVYYDGLVLVEGNYPLNMPPKFNSDEGNSGTWGGREFENLIRNASAEHSGLRVTPWIDDLGARFLPDHTRPSAILAYLLDWQGVGWHYRLTLERLVKTFWAMFGWAHIPLMGSKPYHILAAITIMGISGFIVWFVRQFIQQRGKLPWNIVVLLAFQMLVVWGGTISRGVVYLGNNRLYLPVARYAYTAIIPTMLIITLGWLELLNLLFIWKRSPKIPAYLPPSIWIVILLIIDIWSVLSIYQYYQS